MICRNLVQCPGCGAIIALRISIGYGTEQPFYFVCSHCHAATRGKYVVWYEPPPGGRLELEAGRVVADPEDPQQVVNIHPDLPSVADADTLDANSSPFIMQHHILGDSFLEFYKRLSTFRKNADARWVTIRRWMDYYLNSNWRQFDAEGARVLEKRWTEPKTEFHRHEVIHFALDLSFAPLWVKQLYPDMKAELWSLLKPAIANKQELGQFCEGAAKGGDLGDDQRRVFHCLDLFMTNRNAILPGLAAAMYPAGEAEATKKLRLFRDEFPLLRDIYISAFEACHHVLPYVAGLLNIVERGSADDFGSKGPRNLEQYRKLANAKKSDFLTALPKWQAMWPVILDRPIRNAIGHHSIRHELSSGMIVLRNAPPLPYLEFVIKTLRSVHAIVLAANVLKMVHLIATI